MRFKSIIIALVAVIALMGVGIGTVSADSEMEEITILEGEEDEFESASVTITPDSEITDIEGYLTSDAEQAWVEHEVHAEIKDEDNFVVGDYHSGTVDESDSGDAHVEFQWADDVLLEEGAEYSITIYTDMEWNDAEYQISGLSDGGFETHGAETYSLDVTVENEDGETIDDADVTVDGESDWGELEDGTYTVDADADGYESASEDVTIDGEDKEHTIVLKAEESESNDGDEAGEGDLVIEVVDDDANAVSDAYVEIYDIDDEALRLAQGLTDESGTVLIEDVGEPGDEVEIVVDHDALDDEHSEIIQIEDSEATEVTVGLDVTVEPETHSLDVTVENEDGEVIDDADVTVDGESDWGELEDGTYTVDADAEGYESTSEDVTIDGDDASVTLTLEEEEDDGGTGGGTAPSDGMSTEQITLIASVIVIVSAIMGLMARATQH